jgi:hypothetical protein
MAIPSIEIPAGAEKVSISFIVGYAEGSSCSFYLWGADGKSKRTIGVSKNSKDSFDLSVAPSELSGQTVEWDFTVYSYTGETDEAYSVTVAFLADGVLLHAVPETGTFTKVVKFRDGAVFRGVAA